MMNVFIRILACALPAAGLVWSELPCALDSEQAVPEGIVPDIGRFPWLGLVQHSFMLANMSRFAITSAIYIHRDYAVAAAHDIVKIPPHRLLNNTKLILYHSGGAKTVLEVVDYIVDPEYQRTSLNTIALLEIDSTNDDFIGPIHPICMPVRGVGDLDNLYVVKMTDENADIEKKVFKMRYLQDKECDDFYENAELNTPLMRPTHSICAKAADIKESCIWDSGAALVARWDYGYWQLLGVSARGPGCGAPTRFVRVQALMSWIDDVVSEPDAAPDAPRPDGRRAFALRQVTPYEIIMYKADVKLPTEIGQCDRATRGTVIYKDSSEILVDKNFAQGFFFVEVNQLADYRCVKIVLDTTARTNTGLWVEHHCMHELMGADDSNDRRKTMCYLYFKTAAFIEFRFFFSFRAVLEVALIGHPEFTRAVPDHWGVTSYTLVWYPTVRYFPQTHQLYQPFGKTWYYL